MKKFFHFKNSGLDEAALQFVAASKWRSKLETNLNLPELYEALTFVSQIFRALDFVLFVQRCLNLHDFVYFLINLCENKSHPSTPQVLPSDGNHTPSSASAREGKAKTRSEPGKPGVLSFRVLTSSLDLIIFSESAGDPKMLQKQHLHDHRALLVKFLSLLVVVCLTLTVLTEYLGKALDVELQGPTDPRRTVAETLDCGPPPRVDGFTQGVVDLMNAQEENIRTKQNLFLGVHFYIKCSF